MNQKTGFILYSWVVFVVLSGVVHLLNNINRLTAEIIGFSAFIMLFGLAVLSRREFVRKVIVLASLAWGFFFIYWIYLLVSFNKEKIFVLNTLGLVLFSFFTAYFFSRSAVKSRFR